MEKIKGITKIYDPKSKKMKEIEIEAEIDYEWDELRQAFYPFAESKCPYDGSKVTFHIVFSDDTDLPLEIDYAGGCIHFSQDSGIMFVKERVKEFADRMGWDIEWVGNPGNQYYVFVPKD